MTKRYVVSRKGRGIYSVWDTVTNWWASPTLRWMTRQDAIQAARKLNDEVES